MARRLISRQTLNGRLSPKDGSVGPQSLGKRVPDDPRPFILRQPKVESVVMLLRTLNGRLPPEDSLDRPETWSKRVSDDPYI